MGQRGRGGAYSTSRTATAPTDTWLPVDDLQADTPPPTTPFSEQPGPRISLTSTATPMDFFALFFDDAIIQMLVDGTNNYADEVIAEKERAGSLTPQSRWRTWKSVTIFEMRAVLAVIVNMGSSTVPKESHIGRPAGRATSPSSMMSYLVIGLDFLMCILYYIFT